MPQIEAAGGVLWRGDPASPEVALVHRPKYGDWSLPKGKLDPGEHPLLGALREIAEETGFAARPGRRIGSLRYVTLTGPKRVRYWACEALAGAFVAGREVDDLWWDRLPEALGRLAPERDRRVLAQFAADTRRTRALVVVRHASATDKQTWPGADADRPLDAAGEARTATITALLSAYDVIRAGTADVLRCRQTLGPFGHAAGVGVEVLPATTVGDFEADRARGIAEVAALLNLPGSAAWCGQGEVIPDLVAGLTATWGDGRQDASVLDELPKGALALLHVDHRSRLVAVEQLPD